ncbi:hypothetical protein [uncultured Psychromonas sp.]|uniref:hypothetical protein n=1 Tax=uncultured Psychromonas sp. TaxID=173974 RepID=UPI002616BB01|nr:hypothetical protein [uncultured Psychromonas sp.]
MKISENARELLMDRFPFTEVSTQYIARFETRSGRELALEKDRTDAIYLWLQKYDQAFDGVQIKNKKYPGQAYGYKQNRNSNLNQKNTPKLKVGNKVFYLKIETLSSFKTVVDWYGGL